MNNSSFCLPKADIKYFMTIDDSFNPKGKYWGFMCDSREKGINHIRHDYVDRITYGVYNLPGGCYLEMSMIWQEVSGEFVPKINAYSESISLLRSPTHIKLLEKLQAFPVLFTPCGFSQLLISLGFHDESYFNLTYTIEIGG